MKEKFFDYIGNYGILERNKYQKSYKILLLLGMLTYIDDEGKALYEDILNWVYNYYLKRKNDGLIVEAKDSKISKNIKNLKLNNLKSIIDDNAYKVISANGYIRKSNVDKKEYIKFDEKLWQNLSEKDLKNLENILNDKLVRYYKMLDGFSFNKALQEVLNNYLTARKNEPFSNHKLGILLRNQVPDYLYSFTGLSRDEYIIQGSIGQGNWANIPWIAILNKKITSTTQQGIYIVYLFSEDMERVYLTLQQGITIIEKEYGKVKGREIINKNSKEICEKILGQNYKKTLYLGESDKAKSYQAGTIIFKEYKKGEIPEEEILQKDIQEYLKYYQIYIDFKLGKKNTCNQTIKEYLNNIHSYIKSKGYIFSYDDIANFYLSLKTKPFVLLAGISGTGKSKLVKLFSEGIGANNRNGRYTLIPVRPDWSDPSDLLGYRNIEGKFQAGPLVKVIKRAVEDSNYPYFVCLDEMNLARVEYYFSDILSLIETREFKQNIVTDKILNEEVFGEDNKARETYGNLYIPENLYIIGTVNMDETTYPFSKKVLDRANTIEFSSVNLEVDLNDLITFDEPEENNLENKFLKSKYLLLKDVIKHKEIIEKIIVYLVRINKLLENCCLQFGYRVRDEIIFYVIYAIEAEVFSFTKAFDYAIMQKILPRIQGNSLETKKLLIELFKIFINNNAENYEFHSGNIADKMENYLESNLSSIPFPKSAGKVCKMMRRFEIDGFTTFWQ